MCRGFDSLLRYRSTTSFRHLFWGFFSRGQAAVKPSGLEHSFVEFVRRHGLILPADRVIAAVSGGIDSVVLLRLLTALRSTLPFDLSIAHVNHRLRGSESDDDELFVRTMARESGLEFHLRRSGEGAGPAGAGGVQERAREERYAFFETLRAGPGRARVATAHHRDDNAETVLFNFLRGSGIAGLAGIPPGRADGLVIRPLLFAARREIERYARERGLRHREDASNAGTRYTRNALRHDLIPLIESRINPGIRQTLARTARLFAGVDAYVDLEVDKVLPGLLARSAGDDVRLHAERLASLPPFLKESVLVRTAKTFSPAGIASSHVLALVALLDAAPGAACRLSKQLHARREGGFLVLSGGAPPGEPFDFPVTVGESYDFEAFAFSSESDVDMRPDAAPFEEYVDGDRLGPGLRLRSWSDGDWFIPLGMSERKKLSDYFIDRKIPVAEKRRIPLLVSGDAVVWICGERLDDRFRIAPGTRRIVRLRYEPASG